MTTILPAIARAQDAKIQAYLTSGTLQQFWYAHCPLTGTPEEHLGRLHGLGFDNYPMAYIPAVEALRPYLFFFERILGATVAGVDGEIGDFFHSWCHPCVQTADDVFKLEVDLDVSPLLQAYVMAIQDYLREIPVEEQLPLMYPGMSPLDMACNLCSPEGFFFMLYEEPEAAEYLLDTIVTMQVGVYRRIKALGVRLVSPHGFPGVYCNDLQLASLSPAHVRDFILPCYTRIAAACGGLTLGMLSANEQVLDTTLNTERIIGCAFEKTTPLAAIKAHLGRKLFFIPHYCYDEAFDKPTCHHGIWYNPIVQSYSRELPTLYREFADRYSLLISIERPSLDDVCAVRQALQAGR